MNCKFTRARPSAPEKRASGKHPKHLTLTPPGPQPTTVWENGSTNPSPLVLGESLSQWGEQVDAANIQSRIWPRVS